MNRKTPNVHLATKFIFNLMACKYVSFNKPTHGATTDGEFECCLNENLSHTAHGYLIRLHRDECRTHDFFYLQEPQDTQPVSSLRNSF